MYQLLAPLQHVPCSPQIQASPDYVHLSQGLTLHVILAAIHSANYLTEVRVGLFGWMFPGADPARHPRRHSLGQLPDGGESWFIRLDVPRG